MRNATRLTITALVIFLALYVGACKSSGPKMDAPPPQPTPAPTPDPADGERGGRARTGHGDDRFRGGDGRASGGPRAAQRPGISGGRVLRYRSFRSHAGGARSDGARMQRGCRSTPRSRFWSKAIATSGTPASTTSRWVSGGRARCAIISFSSASPGSGSRSFPMVRSVHSPSEAATASGSSTADPISSSLRVRSTVMRPRFSIVAIDSCWRPLPPAPRPKTRPCCTGRSPTSSARSTGCRPRSLTSRTCRAWSSRCRT